MQSNRERMDILDRLVSEGVELGVGQCRAEDERTDGRRVRIRGRDLIQFASCSYLGLELDPRVIEGAVEAVRAHGVETSSSRVFLSSGLYTEFEALAERIFEAPVVVAPTTTLAHLSALPVLVDEDDAMLMDHKVHSSVQMASKLVHGTGAHLEVARHNDLERLEERVEELSATHPRVWYMADGVYSMFGNRAPIAEIRAMLDRHPQMRFYVDDAHGMSWAGPRGSGTVLEVAPLHPQMVLATGLAKGFGTGGGVVALPDEEQRRRVQTCGPTLLFSGPLQPPILGAAIASARIHLSDEIETLQAALRERVEYCHAALVANGLPVVSPPDTPVGFVGMGPTRACQIISRALQDEGFFINPAQFPAAPIRLSGARFLLSLHQTFEDIEGLVEALARHWEPSVRAAGAAPEEVWGAFGLEMPEAPRARAARSTSRLAVEETELFLERADSIDKLDVHEWDAMLGDRGCLGSDAMRLFESVFGTAEEREQRWVFRYYIVRDAGGDPVLATCFTKSLWKADMLAEEKVSRRVEARRVQDPFHLTQDVFAMGCLLSEGDHLWLRDGADSGTGRAAIGVLLDAVRADAQQLDCEVRVVRDVPIGDAALGLRLEHEGLLAMSVPDRFVLEDVCEDDEALVAALQRDHRRHHRRAVEPWNDAYQIEVIGRGGRALGEEEAAHFQALYMNVKQRSLGLNTFDLPQALIPAIARSDGWEIVALRLAEAPDALPVGFFASYIGGPSYVPVFAGLDYAYVRERGLYRQALRQAVHRARALGRRRVLFGMEAGLEKRRFGARPESARIFLEADDHYAFEALAQIASDAD